MCGIAGILAQDATETPEVALVQRMIQAIAHRGPDGVRVEARAGWTLAHARLSIIDLEGGWQPLHAAGATVIGNGELYNYLETAQAFDLALDLATGSDFEPFLRLFARVGEAALDEVRGMYALCARREGEPPILARDPFGIKPLYVRRRRRDTLFASEPRALFVGDAEPPTVDRERAEELLALNYTLGEASILRDATRVAPGATTASPQRRGWAVELHAPAPTSTRAALARLDTVLEESVRLHQRSDVPYGLFLSGGIDSASIAAMMRRLNTRAVTAFTCGFDAPGACDERAGAERVARALDLDWRETTLGPEDFWRIAPEVAWALDDPTADFATLATYKLAEAARGVLTVVLTGEGGDELFAGYGRYRRALRPDWLGGRPAEPQVRAPFLKDGGAGALARWREAAGRAGVAAGGALTRLQAAQAGDLATWLPNDLLLKLDRCLMAHGLEGRTPFLDKIVADFAFHLPDRMKLRGRRGKWLLRKWLARTCPAADAWGRKQGFTVPVADWIAPHAPAIAPRIAANEGVRQLCNAEAVVAVFQRADLADRRWPLLFYALWWNIHIGGATRAEAAQAVFGPL